MLATTPTNAVTEAAETATTTTMETCLGETESHVPRAQVHRHNLEVILVSFENGFHMTKLYW